jgi:Na+-driven multidrug efflux pump
MYINIIAFILHVPISYYLAISLELGINGLAIATSLHFIFRLGMIYLAVRLSRFNEHLVPLSDPDTLWNLRYQMKMSSQNSVMFIAGQWALDSFTLMSTFMAIEIIAA